MRKTNLSLASGESARISTLSLIIYGSGVTFAVLIVGILAINGVFTPEQNFQGKCFVKAPFGCSEFGVNKDGVRIKLINGAGSAVDIIVSCPAGKRGEKFDGNVEITYTLSGDDVEKVVSGEIESKITNIAGGGGGGSSGGGSSGGGGGSGGSPPSSVCGNNITESGETCDDGNTLNGDGCNSSCQVEVGGVCTNGQTQPCSNQVGVCSGSFETCAGNSWSVCGVSEYGGSYEATENSCSDGLDNDCDGDTDGSDSDCSGGSVITAFATASRISGVAPLAVFFDGFSNTDYNGLWSEIDGDCSDPYCLEGSVYKDNKLTGRKFRDLNYEWSFGDGNGACDGSTLWQVSGKSKNTDNGPIAAHVFDPCPVTGNKDYTVTLTVTDGLGNSDSSQVTIHVVDPNIEFASKTACIRSDSNGDFNDPTGACNGATQITNNDFDDALSDALASGAKRILFRRGDSFSSNIQVNFFYEGPGLVGAFGTGNKPIVNTVYSGGDYSVFTFGRYNTSESTAFAEPYDDWRIMDLDLKGPGSAGCTGTCSYSVFRMGGGISNEGAPVKKILWYHLNWSGYFHGWYSEMQSQADIENAYVYQSKPMEDIAIVESSHSNMRGRAVTWVIDRGALLGNNFDGPSSWLYNGEQHLYRIISADKLLIAHNKLVNAGIDAGTLRACRYDVLASSFNFDSSRNCRSKLTQYVLMNSNIYTSKGCIGLCPRLNDIKLFGPETDGFPSITRPRDVIFAVWTAMLQKIV